MKDPNQLTSATTDAFGNVVHNDYNMLSTLQSHKKTNNLLNLLKLILVGWEETLVRQLKHYVDSGKLTKLTPEQVIKCKSASAHAMFAEGVLSVVTSQKARCPNVRLIYVETKVKTKKNNTLAWLNSKPRQEQEKLMAFASKKTYSILCIRQLRERTIQLETQTRQENKHAKCIKQSFTKIQTAIADIITKDKPSPLSDFPVAYQVAAAVCSITDYEIELFDDILNFCSMAIDTPKQLSKITKTFQEDVTKKGTEGTINKMGKIQYLE